MLAPAPALPAAPATSELRWSDVFRGHSYLLLSFVVMILWLPPGQLSYPSGHSSTSFATGVFWALYFTWCFHFRGGHAAREHCACGWKNDLRAFAHLVVIGAGPAVAAFIAVSRVVDYRHHPADINAGCILGTMCTAFLWVRVLPIMRECRILALLSCALASAVLLGMALPMEEIVWGVPGWGKASPALTPTARSPHKRDDTHFTSRATLLRPQDLHLPAEIEASPTGYSPTARPHISPDPQFDDRPGAVIAEGREDAHVRGDVSASPPEPTIKASPEPIVVSPEEGQPAGSDGTTVSSQVPEATSTPVTNLAGSVEQNADSDQDPAMTPLPACALVVFIHVHKTGGTTIREWVRSMQSDEWKVYGFREPMGKQPDSMFCTGGDCVMGVSQLAKLAAEDPEQYARRHGRVFVEDHGGVHDMRRALLKVRALREPSSAFHQYGCKAATFTILREPRSYLVTMARAHYKYSPFFDLLMQRNGPIRLEDAAWRYDLMKIPHFLDNLLVRQLGQWASTTPREYPAFQATPASVQWYNNTVDAGTVHRVNKLVFDCFDVVGFTHDIPRLLRGLADLVGFQDLEFKAANTHPGLQTHFIGEDWYQDEMDMFERVYEMSLHDRALYSKALHRFGGHSDAA
eukprot:jgi/Tetstr1/449000/TSEL_036225.t1